MDFLLRLQVRAKKPHKYTTTTAHITKSMFFIVIPFQNNSLVGNSVQWRLGFTKASMKSE